MQDGCGALGRLLQTRQISLHICLEGSTSALGARQPRSLAKRCGRASLDSSVSITMLYCAFAC